MQIFLQLIAVESTVMQNMNDYACQAVYRSITAPTAGKHPESLCGTRDYQSTAFLHEALIDLQSCVQGTVYCWQDIILIVCCIQWTVCF